MKRGDRVWILRGKGRGQEARVVMIQGPWVHVTPVGGGERRYRPGSLSDRLPCPHGHGLTDWVADAWHCPRCGDEFAD